MSAFKKLFKIKFWNKIKTPCIQNLPNQQFQWIDCKFFHLIYFSQESPQDNDLRQTLMISLPEIQYWKYCEKITPPSFYIDILFDIAYAPNYNAFSFCYFLSNKFSEYIIVKLSIWTYLNWEIVLIYLYFAFILSYHTISFYYFSLAIYFRIIIIMILIYNLFKSEPSIYR